MVLVVDGGDLLKSGQAVGISKREHGKSGEVACMSSGSRRGLIPQTKGEYPKRIFQSVLDAFIECD
jgi:hypothetical protein